MLENLTIPCAYQGGKQRIAKDIVDIIYRDNKITDETKFYDLCCGSGAVSIEMVKRGFNPCNIIMVDKSPWGLFWRKIGNGEFSTEVFRFYIDDIPKDITKIKPFVSQLLKEPANDGLFDNMIYKFLILQACAFGSSATWVEDNEWKKAGGLRNYWLPTETSNRKSPVNPMMPMPETLYERVCEISFHMESVEGYYSDIMDINIEDNSIIYIDPPYEGTTHYGYSLDYLSFINRHKKNKIYLSEGKQLTDRAILISEGRKKGGINGERKSENQEWLNVFN
jgi:site-specific DNA-adenine methylase